MPTFAAPALNAAESQGFENWLNMQRMAQMRAQTAGQGDFLRYIMSQNEPTAPTAMNPPPGQPSKPATGTPPTPAATAPGQAGTQFKPESATPPPAAGIVPESLRQMVLSIKRNNPNASTDEIMAALATAEPFMDAQQKQAMDMMKQRLDLYKAQADINYKQGSLADREARTKAYVEHLKKLEQRGDPRAITAEGMKILAGTRELQTRLSQINRTLQAGTRPDGSALTADDRKKLGQAVDKLNQAISQSQDYYKAYMGMRAGAYGQQFEAANPPPEEPDVPDSTGGDSGGGQ